jgi:glutamine synthetase
MANDAGSILKLIEEKEIEWVDLRFTDPKGKWQHLSMVASALDEDQLTDGLMFDGSSIEGWKAINESDMILKPDLEASYVDPFSATPMLILFCDIVEPSTGELYGRDPRSTAKRAEAYLKNTGVGDTVYVGPEAEFFMFDDVRFEDSYAASYFKVDDIELPTNSGHEYENGNLAHRPRAKGGYFPVAPVDSAMDIRAEMVSTMLEMGLPMDKHHHEVAASQHELGMTYGGLTQTADRMQIHKYVVHMVAQAYGKTATFMPKPIKGDNGSGMHVHMSIWKGGNPLFAGNGYAGLSETCLYFIGGVIKHAKALNAFTNPTTNSYKRLVPGFEARCCWLIPAATAPPPAASPTARARRPSGSSSASRRDRQPLSRLCCDPDGGPRRHPEPPPPGDPMDKNLYDLPPQELADVPDGLRLASGSASRASQGPRLPDQRRRVQRRPDRRLYGA